MTTKRMCLGAVALGLFGLAAATLPARAADLDAPYLGSQQFPEDKVEFGSGWYIRGDIAATQTYILDLERPSQRSEGLGLHHSHNAGYDLSLGGGYQFTSSIRSDVTADFHQPVQTNILNTLCVDSNNATCALNGKFLHYDALLNGYFDIGTWYNVTPYVGAGLGVGFGELNATLHDASNTYVAKTMYHNLAWALMAGASIDIYDHTKLDIGYRYLNNGTEGGKKLYYHQIRAGLRYMIDN